MRTFFFVFVLAAMVNPLGLGQGREQEAKSKSSVKRVAFISFAPSPYSNRHDCMRAGFGIYLLLDQHIKEHKLPIELSYFDGTTFLDDKKTITRVMNHADVYILGGSTWGQGPTYYVRRFFEQAGAVNMMGVSASAWATAGGAHTGGEEVVHSMLRGMMGMGAEVFTLAQKYMVFTTDERMSPREPGAFAPLDLWYMDRFSRWILVQTLADDRVEAKSLADKFQVSPLYYLQTGAGSFPPTDEELARYEPLRKRLNTASDPDSQAWKELVALLAEP